MTSRQEPGVGQLFERLREDHAMPEGVEFRHDLGEDTISFTIAGAERGLRVIEENGDLVVEVTADNFGQTAVLSSQAMRGPAEAQLEQAEATIVMVLGALLPAPVDPNPTFAVAFLVEADPDLLDPTGMTFQLMADGAVLGDIEVNRLKVLQMDVHPDPAAVFADL